MDRKHKSSPFHAFHCFDNNRYIGKFFRLSSLLASDSSFTDRKCTPGGWSNDNGVGCAHTEHAEQHQRTAPGGLGYPEHMSDTSLSERLLDRVCACPWVMCRSDGLVRVLSAEHAEQLRIPTSPTIANFKSHSSLKKADKKAETKQLSR